MRDFYGDQYPLSAVSADRDPASWDRCTGIFYDDPSNHDVGRNPAFSIGVIGEYIGRIYFEVKKRPVYLIQETNIKEESESE